MSTPGADDEQRRADGYSPAPRPLGEQHEPVYAPTAVNVAAGLWAAAAVLLIAGAVLTLLNKEQIVAEFVGRAQGRRIPAEQIADGAGMALWVLLIGAIAYAGLIGLFAYKAREGTRSARSVLTGLAAVLVLGQFVLFPNILTVAAALAAVAALVLMYLPSVAEHYPRVPKSLP